MSPQYRKDPKDLSPDRRPRPQLSCKSCNNIGLLTYIYVNEWGTPRSAVATCHCPHGDWLHDGYVALWERDKLYHVPPVYASLDNDMRLAGAKEHTDYAVFNRERGEALRSRIDFNKAGNSAD